MPHLLRRWLGMNRIAVKFNNHFVRAAPHSARSATYGCRLSDNRTTSGEPYSRHHKAYATIFTVSANESKNYGESSVDSPWETPV